MTQDEFNRLRPGFPWREVIHPGRGAATIQVLDRFNHDVPLLTIIEFTKFMTAKLASKDESAKEEGSS